jgi:ankyrin repeat protein
MQDGNKPRAMLLPTLGLLQSLLGGYCPTVAWADWSEAGAQYSCNKAAKSFEILPYDVSSDSASDSVLGPGFKTIALGTTAITCNLGTYALKAVIEVYPPAAHGQCMGGGFVRARSISIRGVELLPDAPSFNWTCMGGDAPLIKIHIVTQAGSLTLERCYGAGAYGAAVQKEHCDVKKVEIDALAAKKAELEHHVADVSTQESMAAATLPPENDYANVFVSAQSIDRAIPSCAHWTSIVQRPGNAMLGVPGSTPHARVGGTGIERLYIHRANPQVCDSLSEPMCRSKAYVIPGDRVEVGFICGRWTYIRYPAETNASQPTDGWVETDRLYGIDSLITPNPQLWTAYWTKFTRKDPLGAAVANGDLTRIKELIESGADPIGPDEALALRIAINGQNLSIVAALLSRGAKVNANCPAIVQPAVFTSQEVLDALIRAGLDVTCDKSALIMLAGADRILDLENRLSGWGSWAPIRDMPSRVLQLIAAGIPVNWALPSGKTALIATITPNNVDVAQVLLKAGANANIVLHKDGSSTDAYDGTTALLQAVVAYSSHLDPTMVRALLDGGANPNYRSEGEYYNAKDALPGAINTLGGVTALHVAAEHGYLALTRILLDHGADPHIARSDGALPADIARNNGHPDVAALIESYLRRH